MANGSLAPGVRVVETAPVALPANVGPTLTGFLGQSRRGRVDVAQIVTRWSEFVSLYGGFTTSTDLGIFIRQFFDNGGAACRVLRMAPADAVAADTGSDVLSRAGASCMTVTASNPGEWGNDLALKFALEEVTSTGGQVLVDADGGEYPNTNDNVNSINVASIPVDDITKIAVGDAVSVFTAAGTSQFNDVVYCLGIDAAERSILVERHASLDVVGGYYLRTGSQHRLRTFAKEGLATGQTSLLLDSVAGIKRGSVLVAHLFSHCKTISARGQANLSKFIVDRVSGNRVYLTAAAVVEPVTKDIPATTSAALRYIADAGVFLDFVANDVGTAGNKVAVVVNVGQASNTVTVSGKTITINSDDTYTLADVKTDIEALAAADALVTVTITGDDTTAVVDAMASTRLSGGAQLQVTSQEFGMEVYLGEDLAEKHNYLSLVSTSPDYIGSRLGGNPTTYEPDSGSESNLIIVSGLDTVVGAGDAEFITQPRALSSVGFSGGDDGSALTDDDWIGTESPLSGARKLASYDDLKLCCAPGVTAVDVQKSFADRADESQKFIWLLDPPSDVASASDVVEHRTNDLGLNTSRAQLANTYAVIRDVRPDSAATATLDCPPTPAWAGLIAKAQAGGGSHKSCGNQVPSGWVRVKYNAGPVDAETLNERGICVFRVVAGSLRCYGDRTLLQADDPRKFGNAARFVCQFIHDAEAALADVVFQPGNEDIFPLVESKLTRLLTAAHAVGALYPRTDIKRAFTVACNEETTSPEEIAAGRFYAEVAMSLSTLAEQIILKLQVSSGGLRVSSNL